MKKILLMLLCAAYLPVMAGSRVVKLWDGCRPKYDNKNTQPSTTDQWGHVSNVVEPTITVYLAQGASKPTKAVLVVPGGGYEIVSMTFEGSMVGQYLANNGVTAIILKYRLPKGVSGVPLEDALRAMQIVRDSAAAWNIDPRQIGVMGFSAGGHLASTLCVRAPKKLRPAFAILYYPVISFQDGITHEGSRANLTGGDKTLYHYYSNYLHVTSKTPRTLIFHSADDTGVPLANSELYVEALRKAGVESRLVVLPTGGHGWGWRAEFAHRDQMLDELSRFLK